VTFALEPHTLQEMGFSIIKQNEDIIKIVKGRCEIYITDCGTYTRLELPVINLWGKRKSSLSLMEYLLDRNGELNGPGFFGIKDRRIYYISIIQNNGRIEETALEMQRIIEKLGPKIMNIAKQ